MTAVTPTEGDRVLSVRGLCVSYESVEGPTAAVTDVGFDLAAGEILGIIGESGSGKSTLGRAILGMLPHGGRVTAGQASLEVGSAGSVDLLTLRPRQLQSLRGPSIAMVPQATASALHPYRRVGVQFEQTYRAHGLRGDEAGLARARQALEDVGMSDADHVLGLYPYELSGGMAQRVVVALAAALGPSVLVADEPTSALDVTVQRRLLDNLARGIRAHRRACLLITHDLGVVANYCDRVLVMYGGSGVEMGPIRSILQAPAHPFTARLMSAVPGRARRAGARDPGTPGAPTVEHPQGRRCPYAAACGDSADPRCLTAMPPWRQVGTDHLVRGYCHPEADATEEQHVVS